jgi:hypothetical protein
MNLQFEIGKTYRGGSGCGECAITIVKRTEQTVWVQTSMHKSKACRVNTKWHHKGAEMIKYMSWYADPIDEYTEEQQIKDLYYAAYNR